MSGNISSGSRISIYGKGRKCNKWVSGYFQLGRGVIFAGTGLKCSRKVTGSIIRGNRFHIDGFGKENRT